MIWVWIMWMNVELYVHAWIVAIIKVTTKILYSSFDFCLEFRHHGENISFCFYHTKPGIAHRHQARFGVIVVSQPQPRQHSFEYVWILPTISDASWPTIFWFHRLKQNFEIWFSRPARSTSRIWKFCDGTAEPNTKHRFKYIWKPTIFGAWRPRYTFRPCYPMEMG